MKLEELSPQKTSLVRNEEQVNLEVPRHDWNYLKRLIDSICPAEPIHLTLGGLFLGVAISAFFGALSLDEDEIIRGFPGRLLAWSVFGAFFLSSIPCLLYAYMKRNDINRSKKEAMDYLIHIEERFGNLDEVD